MNSAQFSAERQRLIKSTERIDFPRLKCKHFIKKAEVDQQPEGNH